MNSVDLCLLCLQNRENTKSILAQDSDGIVIKEKCTYFLSELVDIKPEISYHICWHCLKDLNYVYNLKQTCSQNIMKLNNYVNTLTNKHGSYKHFKVTQKDNKLACCEIKNYPDTVRIESLNTYSQTQQDRLESIVPIKIEVEEILPNELIPPNGRVTTNEEIAEYPELQDENVEEDEEEAMNIDENYEEIEIVKEELEYNRDEIGAKLFLEIGTGETSGSSEPTNNSDCNSTSTNGYSTGKNYGMKTKNRNNQLLYKCDQCHKAFCKASILETHYRIHTGNRPYKCTICPKSFTQLVILQNHERIHNDVRFYRYECEVCNRTFLNKTSVTYHMRIHTREKPYQCQFCNYKCATLRSINAHMHKHARTCEYCERSFKNAHTYECHKRSYHKNKV